MRRQPQASNTSEPRSDTKNSLPRRSVGHLIRPDVQRVARERQRLPRSTFAVIFRRIQRRALVLPRNRAVRLLEGIGADLDVQLNRSLLACLGSARIVKSQSPLLDRCSPMQTDLTRFFSPLPCAKRARTTASRTDSFARCSSQQQKSAAPCTVVRRRSGADPLWRLAHEQVLLKTGAHGKQALAQASRDRDDDFMMGFSCFRPMIQALFRGGQLQIDPWFFERADRSDAALFHAVQRRMRAILGMRCVSAPQRPLRSSVPSPPCFATPHRLRRLPL